MSLQEGLHRKEIGLQSVIDHNDSFYLALKEFFIYELFPSWPVGKRFTLDDVRPLFLQKFGHLRAGHVNIWGSFGKIVRSREVSAEIRKVATVESKRKERNAGTLKLYEKISPGAVSAKKKRLWIALNREGTGAVSIREEVVRDYIAQAPPSEHLVLGSILVSDGFCSFSRLNPQ